MRCRTTDTWRDEAARAGIGELHLARVESGAAERDHPALAGLRCGRRLPTRLAVLATVGARGGGAPVGHRVGLLPSPYRRHIRAAYSTVAAAAVDRPAPPYIRYPTVVPSWDNSARRDYGAVILEGANPDAYEQWVRAALAEQPELLFVNAWNEWGEGCHLEPDERWGRAYLEAHLRATCDVVVTS